MSQHTVLEFTFIEFDENWKREAWAPGAVYVPIAREGTLWVVTEDRLGNKTTYIFKVQKEMVGVSYSENLVFIPAKCVKREKGDITRCTK